MNPSCSYAITNTVISQFGRIIRIENRTVRSANRSTQGVRLRNLYNDDKVAAAMTSTPKTPKPNPKTERCCSEAPTTNRGDQTAPWISIGSSSFRSVVHFV